MLCPAWSMAVCRAMFPAWRHVHRAVWRSQLRTVAGRAVSTSTATAKAGMTENVAPPWSINPIRIVTGNRTCIVMTASSSGFGGNCTVEGLSDDEICIGDRIGGALLEELEIRPAQDQ